MAIIENIPEKNQTPSAQKGVIDYCIQPSKTLNEDEHVAYVSGVNCIPEFANQSFLATQKIFGHAPDGVRFYHYVQSFKVEENISPKEAHDIGLELSKGFGNREVLIATHIDREHIHNHFVVCAYGLESGIKLHNNKFYLGELRNLSDKICREHGFDVLKKYNPNVKSERLGPKEYRAAERGNSWKMALRVAIDYCMTRAENKSEFQNEMRKFGYDMIWTPERKYITYICRTDDGKEHRVRDIKLTDNKYLKENMEYEFRIRTELYGQAEGKEYTFGTAEIRRGTDNSDSSDQRGGMEQAVQDGTANASAFKRFDDTESRFEELGGELRRYNEKGGTGANRSLREGDTEDSERSHRTGWEGERESFRSYRETYRSGRSNMVDSPRAHGSSDDIGIAVMGARGFGNLSGIFDDSEETEEEKQRREADNAGVALGAVAGLAVGIALGLAEEQATPDEDIDDSEDEDFDITM